MKVFLGILFLGIIMLVSGQSAVTVNGYPQGYFKSPLNIPLTLAGNFGEPRTGHFHTGLDFKTNSQEGLPVYASAEGYISRINVSAFGYGNALYITHPNGFVTVYGHLQKFNDKIKKLLEREQYAKKSFAVNFYPKPGDLPVTRGELIALSGNSGGSGGPHLHFEIRDSLERALNPLLFGFKLADQVKPTVNAIKFYALDQLKFKSDGYRAKLSLIEGEYRLPGGLLKLNAEQVGFSVNTFDRMSGSENSLGIYAISVYDNGELVYEYGINRVAFDEKRYVLSHVDYPVFMHEGRRAFHKCFVEPANKCPVYFNLSNNGIIDLSDGKKHAVEIEIRDYPGNPATIKFSLQYDKAATVFKPRALSYTTRFDSDKENNFNTADIKVNMPAGYIFDTVHLGYSFAEPEGSGIYSKVHRVGHSDIPVFNWFDVAVKADTLPVELRNKAAIIYRDDKGSTTYRGGKYHDGFIVTKVREFGKFYVRVDTTAPAITPVNITAGKNMRASKKIVFKITDNLAGVDSFSSAVDGEWAITEYDGKSATFTHYIPPGLPAGGHTYRIEAWDERRNYAAYEVKFVW